MLKNTDMKKLTTLFIIFHIFLSLTSQNIECEGNSISIPLKGYKIGHIQWQFSNDNVNWADIPGQTSITLLYTLIETGYIRANVSYGNCDYNSDITFVEVYPTPTTANAGSDQSITSSDTFTTLSANIPDNGKGKWSIISGDGGRFENDTLATTRFSASQCNGYTLRWTISTKCRESYDDLNVDFHDEPSIADAGENQLISTKNTVSTLSANTPDNGKGKWSIVSGDGGHFENDTLANTSFTGKVNSEYLLKWTISTNCDSSSDMVYVNFGSVIMDVDDNIYDIVEIGSQIWMGENLNTTHYNDGNPIQVTNSHKEFIYLETGGICWYDYDSTKYASTYGALYTWSAVNTDKLCPMNWHVPTKEEWLTLIDFVGNSAAKKLKESGVTHWKSPNNATNNFNFTALPGGYNAQEVSFGQINNGGYWWTSTEQGDNAYKIIMSYNKDDIRHIEASNKTGAKSVRCIKDL